MRAAVLREVGGPLHVEELTEPIPGDGEVLVQVTACGVCHTDLHVQKGEVAFPMPCVLGHEISGTVAGLGAGVEGLAEGDRVACSFMIPCGTCRHCVRGQEDLCEAFFAYNRLRGVLYDGATRLYEADGSPVWMYSMSGLAEYCVVPATDVFALPDSVELHEAAILGCSVFTSYGAVKNVAHVQLGETVAVVAAGGVGLNLIQLAAAFGAVRIIAVDVSDEKLALARLLGATDVVNATTEDPVEVIKELTGGRGVDVAFEALGSAATVETAVKVVDDGGRVVLVGIAPAGTTAAFEITHVVRRKIKILGSYGARARTDMPVVLRLAAEGRVNVSDLITTRFTLEGADDAYQRLSKGAIVGRAIVEMDR